MAKRISKLAASIRQLGDLQVNEWDFMALLNKAVDTTHAVVTNALKETEK